MILLWFLNSHPLIRKKKFPDRKQKYVWRQDIGGCCLYGWCLLRDDVASSVMSERKLFQVDMLSGGY